MIVDKSEKLNNFNKPPNEVNYEIKLNRKECNYKNLSSRFTYVNKDFKKQFAHIYSGRLALMKDRVAKNCVNKWGKDIQICKLSELSDETSKKCIVIGTIFKHQQLKPSILKELSDENQVLPQPPRSHFVSDSDVLILEDEIQRIRLIGNFDVTKHVTGVVVGVLGFENDEGKFEVEDMCFAEPELKLEKSLTIQDDSYVLMVSGLKVGSAESSFALELLVDCIRGDLGSVVDQENWAKVCRMIIVGNSVAIPNSVPDTCVLNTELQEGESTLKNIKELDNILSNLSSSIEIDLMPGEFDPSNHILPQQAIYNCVFPEASRFQSFNCVTNPYECKLEGRSLLGTSGQPVNNIKALTDLEEPLEILEKTLTWGHLAPTAPDTLACYPYYQEDPFIINETPDVYFVGNQPQFQTKVIEQRGFKTRLICIPSFYKTKTCVLVNLKNLACTPVVFSV